MYLKQSSCRVRFLWTNPGGTPITGMLHCPLEPLSLSHSSILAKILTKSALKTPQRGVLSTRYEARPIIKTRIQIQALQLVVSVFWTIFQLPLPLFRKAHLWNKVWPFRKGFQYQIKNWKIKKNKNRNKDGNKEENKYCVFNDLLLSPKPQLFL